MSPSETRVVTWSHNEGKGNQDVIEEVAPVFPSTEWVETGVGVTVRGSGGENVCKSLRERPTHQPVSQTVVILRE